MSLLVRLDECIARAAMMTKQIAEYQFGDDSPSARTITRRWGIQEVAKMIGISQPTIRAAEDDGRLPVPDMVQRGFSEMREGYTIYQIQHMREVFGTAPRRLPGQPCITVGVAAHKGGAYKTSSSVHLAQWLSMQGWRVLLIDATDPQATASLYHGYVPDLHIHADDTLLPFYLGERTDVHYAIKPTCWPSLDIIPSCLAIHRIESEVMPLAKAGLLPTAPHELLRAAIATVSDDYDIVVIDSAPNLGVGTMNVVCASDVLITPTPAEMYDYSSAQQFFVTMRDLLATIDLHGFEPDVRVLVTKYSNAPGSQSAYMEECMREAFGNMVMQSVVRVTDEVGKGQVRMRTVFEQAANQRSTRKAWDNAVGIWEPVCNEIYERLIKPRWNTEEAA